MLFVKINNFSKKCFFANNFEKLQKCVKNNLGKQFGKIQPLKKQFGLNSGVDAAQLFVRHSIL